MCYAVRHFSFWPGHSFGYNLLPVDSVNTEEMVTHLCNPFCLNCMRLIGECDCSITEFVLVSAIRTWKLGRCICRALLTRPTIQGIAAIP